ncbi:MAG: carboxypeptidase regulatory-like domain-containing protein [Holophagales bacterium]|nr:carboxypeptidase regulatory-like domain-containing protein [Holophagales bacterium]MYC09433.1 carboxypeptidase regulatory-like domain-containing protein [Holophagales bacterium]
MVRHHAWLVVSALVVAAAVPAYRPLIAQVAVSVQVDANLLPGEATPEQAEVVLALAPTREVVGRYTVNGLPGSVTASVPHSDNGWIAQVSAPGWWAPAVRLTSDSPEASLALVPEGLLRFRLEGADVGVEMLDSASVRVFGRVWRQGTRLARGIHGGACEVDLDRDDRDVSVTCPFALAETADIKVLLGPFLAWARPGVVVAEDTDFGTFVPVLGASVSGRIRGTIGQGPFLLALSPRNGSFPVTTWTDEQGVFLFEGVAAGAYDLNLESSPQDRWAVRVESLQDQIDLGEIVSASANRFSVDFSVPPAIVDELVVKARPVTLREDGAPELRLFGEHLAKRAYDGSSVFIWSGIPGGPYYVSAEGSWGNRWYRGRVDFSHASPRHAIDLDGADIRGRIRRGAEPLENVLVWFGGLTGGQRVVMKSRHDGRFDGWLPARPHLGDVGSEWHVQVTQAPACDPCEGDWTTWQGFDSGHVVNAGVVEIVENADGVGRVEIDLPAGRINGRVLRVDAETADRSAVSGANVRLSAEDHGRWDWSAVTSPEGDFEFLAVPEGDVELVAEAWLDDRSFLSGRTTLRLSKGDAVEDVEILAKSQWDLNLLVRARNGPLSNAAVLLRDTDSGAVQMGWTLANGSAQFWVPPGRPVELAVLAAGLGSDGWRIESAREGALEVELFETRGDLLLPDAAEATIVNSRGVSLPLQVLRHAGQIRDTEEGPVVMNLAPGNYNYCPVGTECALVQVIAGTLNRLGS